MVSILSKNVWMRRQQCPCGDWKCFVTYEGDAEETAAASQSIKNDSPSAEAMVAPYVGMVFKSDDDAFEYYGNFARKNGFSIRKERSRLSPQLGIYKRDFVCYRSGFAPARKKPTGEHHRDRKSVRCGCDAKMYLSKEVVDGVSQWFVVQFSNVHNHELLEDDQVCLLPAYRKIHEADQERILLLSKAGFPIHRIVKVLELEKGIQGGQLPFLERDVRNFVQNRKKVVQENDALLTEKRENDTTELLESCRALKEGDQYFVYDVTVDENDKVENIAWSYGDSVHMYDMFGDVVYFDTTYRSITYGMLFGAWLGIDNHGKIVFLGCVLLQDETPRSFAWALQTFVQFMKGRCPQTILTDLDPGLRDAIRSELPNTKHVISIWDILPKLSCWFSLALGHRYADLRTEFDALYHLENSEDFEFRWNQMVGQYGISSDKHIALLFSLRTSWALPYIKGCFLARMATTAYSKSVDAFLKGVFSAQTCLRSVFEQVRISSTLRIQAREEMQYVHIRTCLPIEEHARSILTPFAFNALQHELVLAMQYASSQMTDGSYIVRHFKKMDGEHLVIWIPEQEQIHCSCKEFECSGILCRHALRVLLIKNYFQLPEKYFPCRWQKESSLVPYDDQDDQNGTDEWFQEFNSLTGTLFTESSITKERSDYVHRELTKELKRLINVVRNMPASDAVAMDLTRSPTG
ncbi:Protein FAR1-RELATED SEQUENCE 10 [Actinidia chinensis var. chinensis]|uniref:Protein FAR1-RELATED SEQUENCE n=1 Tax=Actinidia chinensis var. chinensis TaxID=1590841 RepID=A0A2R6Q9S9_ACTCC|nr:Protein FAR1-RELATED SEQUENCE 10 [Actinidia chinensis var. chinensis]